MQAITPYGLTPYNTTTFGHKKWKPIPRNPLLDNTEPSYEPPPTHLSTGPRTVRRTLKEIQADTDAANQRSKETIKRVRGGR